MSNFYYEHIGHMQCCEITLQLYKHLYELSKGEIGKHISIKEIIYRICFEGFSEKQAVSELDRFYYGGLAQDHFDGTCSTTYIFKDYYTQIINESRDQKNIIAVLARESKLKNKYNITLQETTFFDPRVYEIINRYKLRSGGARDFIRSVTLQELNDLVQDVSTVVQNERFPIMNIDDLISLVKTYGKYWASVGGNYSWIIFSQRYYVEVEFEEYRRLIAAMGKPVEWGGKSKDLSHHEIVEILGDEAHLKKFVNNLIVRKLKNGDYRLTCPGYLMFERMEKGRIFEFELRRVNDECFELLACNADDCLHKSLFPEQNTNTLMRLRYEGTLEEIKRLISTTLTRQYSF